MIKPYLMFPGTCEEAFDLYVRAFGGELLKKQRYGDMPPNPAFPVDEDEKKLILNAELKLTDSGFIMGCDSGMGAPGGSLVSISVELDSEEKARKVWNMLKEGGAVRMELAPVFFAKLHGSLTDKYGVTWLFSVM